MLSLVFLIIFLSLKKLSKSYWQIFKEAVALTTRTASKSCTPIPHWLVFLSNKVQKRRMNLFPLLLCYTCAVGLLMLLLGLQALSITYIVNAFKLNLYAPRGTFRPVKTWRCIRGAISRTNDVIYQHMNNLTFTFMLYVRSPKHFQIYGSLCNVKHRH